MNDSQVPFIKSILHPTDFSAANKFSSDAIIMTTAGHEGIFDVLRGSTTEQILRKINCPLLAVPKSWAE